MIDMEKQILEDLKARLHIDNLNELSVKRDPNGPEEMEKVRRACFERDMRNEGLPLSLQIYQQQQKVRELIISSKHREWSDRKFRPQ